MTDGTTKLTTEQQYLIKQAAERLKGEFAGVFSVETIERFMTESQAQLESRATVTTWLPILIERFARDRFRALAKVEGLMTDQRPAVLFLCVHNAGRSQMAAGWLRHLAGDTVDVFSGGSEPADQVNPGGGGGDGRGRDRHPHRVPQPWTDELVRAADVVITMGCGDACPVYPGKRYEDWELTDPAGQPVEFVRPVRDDIQARVQPLMTSLDIATQGDAGRSDGGSPPSSSARRSCSPPSSARASWPRTSRRRRAPAAPEHVRHRGRPDRVDPGVRDRCPVPTSIRRSPSPTGASAARHHRGDRLHRRADRRRHRRRDRRQPHVRPPRRRPGPRPLGPARISGWPRSWPPSGCCW